MGISGLILRIGAIVFVVEAGIMLVLMPMLGVESSWSDSLLDGFLLTALSSPLLFYGVIRPYAKTRRAIEQEATTARSKSERHLAQVMDTAVDGIITIDEKGHVTAFNKAAETIFGYGTDEVIGNKVDMLMPEPYSTNHDAYLQRYYDTGRAHIIGHGREVTGRRKDGSTFPMDLAVSEMIIDGSRIFTGIVRDIRYRKEFENELIAQKERAEQASRVKSEFLANMSHELRTPLNAIIGFSEITKSEIFGPLGDEKYRGYIVDIQQSASHLLDLINDILDLARIEADKFDLDEELFTVDEVVEPSVHLVDFSRVTFRKNIAADLPKLRADKRRVKQIVLNLLSNAAKFTPDGGEVGITVARDPGGGISFEVWDTGIGMDPDGIGRALRPFEQVDSGLARKYEGAGLGLPLSRRLAQVHGASFEIDSEADRGTRVRVVFGPERTVA